VAPDPDHGVNCNPYGPCEEWCALFATWAWRHAGIPIPSYAFTGDMYTWAAGHGAVLPPTATPAPGDAVLYGTSPRSTATSVHVGVVAQVWPDGSIVTVDGNAGPGRDGSLSVVINGPFLPVDSPSYNAMPIYAFAQP
jgi:CHAP domain